LQRVTSSPPRIDRGSRRASARSAGGASELRAAIGLLEGAAIPIDEIGLRRPTLDEAFLALTADQGQDRSPQ